MPGNSSYTTSPFVQLVSQGLSLGRRIRHGMCLAVLAGVCLSPSPAVAGANWLITPFVGVKLGGDTNMVDLDQAAGEPKLTVGGSLAILGERALGVEMDLGYSPRFFDAGHRSGLVAHSHVTTLTGNAIVAVPVSLTRESLRPFLVGGIGLMRVRIDDVLNVFRVQKNFLAFDLGAGAMGTLTRRTSVRFELRRFQNLTQKENGTGIGFGPSRLTFWRATTGLMFRY